LDFLFGDDAAELVERLIRGGELEFLLSEFFAGFCDVLVVLADAGFQFGFPLLVEMPCGRRRSLARFCAR
jgi:hypothetical protein